MQPGTGIGPVSIRGGTRNTENGGGFLNRQAAEESQLHKLGFRGIFGRELVECFGQVEQVVGRKIVDRDGLLQVDPLAAAAALVAALGRARSMRMWRMTSAAAAMR